MDVIAFVYHGALTEKLGDEPTKRLSPDTASQDRLCATHWNFQVPDGQRAAVFDESLDLLRSVLKNDHVTYTGHYVQLTCNGLGSRPAEPLDIWLGGSVPAAFRRIGRFGDGWLGSFLTPEEARHGWEVIQAAAAEADRNDPAADTWPNG